MPTVPATGMPVPMATSVNVAVVNVALLIGSENIAANAALRGTPVVPACGDVDRTVGGVVSDGAAVVNVQLKSAASALPATSRAPVVMVARYCVPASRAAAGVKV